MKKKTGSYPTLPPLRTIDLNHTVVFREVVMAGSFTRAATALGLPKSRVSRTISAFERDLGVQLIYRTTRSFQLTDAGSALFGRIAGPLQDLSDVISAVTSFGDEVAGPLRISGPEDVGVVLLGEICREFMLNYPKVSIDLRLENRFVDLVKESVDVALRIGRLKDSSMSRRGVGSIKMLFIMSSDLRDRSAVVRTPADLAVLPFINFAASKIDQSGFLAHRGKDSQRIKPTSRFVANNYFVVKEMVIRGAGWGLVPSFLVGEELRRGTLVQILKDWGTGEIPVQLVTPRQREPAPRVERFMEFASKKLTPHFS